MKMYHAEVLSKRVVVQHTPLGGLIPWDEDEENNFGKPVLGGVPPAGTGQPGRSSNMGPPSIPIPTMAPGRIPPLGTQTQRAAVGPTSFPSVTSIPTVFPTARRPPPP